MLDQVNRLQSLLANKHTSGAAAVYGLASVVGHIAWTWFPNYTHQIESTVGYIKEACFVWMGVAATDSTRVGQQIGQAKQDVATAIDTGNTEQLTKPQTETKP